MFAISPRRGPTPLLPTALRRSYVDWVPSAEVVAGILFESKDFVHRSTGGNLLQREQTQRPGAQDSANKHHCVFFCVFFSSRKRYDMIHEIKLSFLGNQEILQRSVMLQEVRKMLLSRVMSRPLLVTFLSASRKCVSK